MVNARPADAWHGPTLALDAAAASGTIAVLRDGALVAEGEVAMRSATEERYFPAVLALLGEAGVRPRDLQRIVCGAGPGSFTSLRVAGAVAKGLATGLDVPLLGMPSLALLVAASDATAAPGTQWLATLDAMRDERYLALVGIGEDGAVVSVRALGIAPTREVEARAASLGATAIGPEATVVARPHARGVVRCLDWLAAAGPVPVDSWEPVYGRLAEAQARREAALAATPPRAP